LYVDLPVAGQHAVLQGFLHPLLDRADVLPRDRAPHDLVLEHEPRPGLTRLEVDDDVPVLAAAPRLANELAFDVFDPLADRLAVGHLRPADAGVDPELPLHAVDVAFEVPLRHPAAARRVRRGRRTDP